jgi:glycosyltransferase involved in cell wall biosynthesis
LIGLLTIRMQFNRKVLHVYIDFEPTKGGGGVARHIAGLAKTVACSTIQVRVVAPVVDATAGGGFYEVERAGWIGILRHIAWADVVHIHGSRKLYSALAALWAFLSGRNVIYTPHCYYDDDTNLIKKIAKRLWNIALERLLLRYCNAVILLSDYWHQYLLSHRMPAMRTVIVPNCVVGSDIAALRRQRGDHLSGRPALLSVGRLDPVKRIDDAIRALTDPLLDEAVLHIVGRGPDSLRLAEIADELGVNARVQFYGFLSDEAVAQMAADADVFVMPSAAEGMPTVLIEMILMGLPVVASDIPGNRAILDRIGLDGMFPVGNVPRLAEQIVKAVATPVTSSIEYVTSDNFTWERTAHRIAALYRDQTLREEKLT